MLEKKNKSVSGEKFTSASFERPPSPITDSLVGMFADTGEDYKVMMENARRENLERRVSCEES